MIQNQILDPAKLTGSDKEEYLFSLSDSLKTLSSSIADESKLNSTLTEFLDNNASMVELLKYYTDQNDPVNNTGVFSEIEIDTRFGFPGLEYIILFSSKSASGEKELKRLGSKDKIAESVIDTILNGDDRKRDLNIIDESDLKIRKINFYERLKIKDFTELQEGLASKNIHIKLINEDQAVENFNLFYSGWDLSKGYFSAYSIELDDDKEKYMKIGPEKPGHVFKDEENKHWKIGSEIRSLLGASFGLHPKHYFDSLNKLEGIHPRSIQYLGLERFESRHSNKNFKDIIDRHPNSVVLTATLITLEGGEETGFGKTRQTKLDIEKNSSLTIYAICSEKIQSEVIEIYKHSEFVNFKVIPF